MKNARALLAALLILLGAKGAHARDDQQTEAGAIRLALTDILVQEVKSGRQASFALRWDYLPLSESLKNRFARVFTFDGEKLASADEFVVPNKTLRKGVDAKQAWFAGLKEKRLLLANALTRGSYATLKDVPAKLEDVLTAGEAAWNESLVDAFEIKKYGRPTARTLDYLAAKRDFYAMLYLLRNSDGAGAVLEFEPKPRGANPLMVADGLTWRIKVFSPDASNKGKQLFRFAVSVQTPTIKKLFRGSEDAPAPEKPTVAATVGLLKRDTILDADSKEHVVYRMRNVTLAQDGTTVETQAAPGADKLKSADASKLSPSSGETALDVFAGTSLKGLLSPLIANDSEAQIFTGGLIGRGEPKGVIGLNYIFTEQPDGNLGFLYGFVPNADASDGSLFLGPSLQFGPFVLGVGALVFARKDESVAATLGATLSVDLSRAFGHSPRPIQLSPKPLAKGTEVWQDSEKLYENLNLAFYRVQFQGGAPTGAVGPIRVQEIDASGDPVAKGFSSQIPAETTTELQVKIVPKSRVLFTAPAGYKIVVHERTSKDLIDNAALEAIPDTQFADSKDLVTKGNRPLYFVLVLKKS